LDKDRNRKTKGQARNGGIPDDRVQGSALVALPLIARTIADGFVRSRFMEQEQLTKRKIRCSSLTIHGVRGFAEDIRRKPARTVP